MGEHFDDFVDCDVLSDAVDAANEPYWDAGSEKLLSDYWTKSEATMIEDETAALDVCECMRGKYSINNPELRAAPKNFSGTL